MLTQFLSLSLSCTDLEYDHLDYSRPIQAPNPHYHRATSSAMSTLSHRDDRNSNQSTNKFGGTSSSPESTYDAPIPHPKKLNIAVPPLPEKNFSNAPSPSSSTASTITQDDNIDAVIDKPMNKDLSNAAADRDESQTDN